MYIKFLNTNSTIECLVIPNGNIVTLQFKNKVIVNTSGFRCYLDKNCEYDISGDSYVGFTTIYRNDEETEKYNGYKLSNDGSIWIKPLPKVAFHTNGGGTLEGETEQEAYTYEELVIPAPVAFENYEFTGWAPKIPESGEIDSDKSFTAVFVSTLPQPELVPTLEEEVTALKESVSTLENDIRDINNVLGGDSVE